MSAENYTVLHPKTFDTDALEQERFSLDVLMGLSAPQKSLPSKYLYDERGSQLFARITDLEEYYPTACEFEILRNHYADIAAKMPEKKFSIIELGAGDGRKTKVLLKGFLDAGLRFKYIPIDISESAMSELTRSLGKEMPGLETEGIVAEYFDALKWLNQKDSDPKFVLFLGSNIGNFNRPQTLVFLRTLWNALDNGDHLLIGFDLKKNIDVLLRAYNDSHNITREFNLNLIDRINKELGGNFKRADFDHFGTYDVFSGAMKSYLVSLRSQDVDIKSLNKRFHFDAYEAVHLEYSYKYLLEDVSGLGEEAGFQTDGRYLDAKKYFLDTLWQVRKEISA